MPKQYEAIRDKFQAQGMSSEEAKRRAAKIFNARHPGKPVFPGSDKKRKKDPG